MWSSRFAWLCACLAVGACDKPPLVKYPGESAAQVGGFNTKPTVEAGESIMIRWPQAEVELRGSAADDGLPTNEKLRTTWTAAAGSVVFDNPLAMRTVARFGSTGTYVLTLTASDGALHASDSVLVTVADANAAPQVDAGPDRTGELPFGVVLQGAASDDGVPQALSVQWSLESGPAIVTLASPTQLDASARFTKPGVYTLRLTVDDGELSSSDVVRITMQPAVYPAPDLTDSDPDRGWLRVAPDVVGMDAAALDDAERYALAAGGAGLVVRKGRLVRSWGNIDQRYDLKSTTKSIAAMTVAIALDEGKINLTDPASTHLPGFGRPPDNDLEQLRSITLLQLATHTSGFEKHGGYGRLVATPGEQWIYSDGALNWLADVMTQVHGRDLNEFFVQRIWPTLGVNEADDIRWRSPTIGQRREPRPNGLVHREFASGFVGNTNALARVGLLYLRQGVWREHQVFTPSFVPTVSTPHALTAAATVSNPLEFPDANVRYGVLWWTNATGALSGVPRDAYWAWGLGDSLIVVIPSLDLVIARAGPIRAPSPGRREFGDNDWTGEYDVLEPFLDPIVRAVIDEQGP